MKRIICLALCALTAVFGCGCKNENEPTEPAQATPEESVVQQTSATEAPAESDGGTGLKSFISRFDTAPTVEEQLVYTDKYFSVTVTGIRYSAISGPELMFSIESSYPGDIIVQSPYAVINGYMIHPEMSVGVEAEKSAKGTMTLPYFNLAISDIISLKTIEFSLRMVEAKSYEPIVPKTELISVATSAPQDTETECDESGQTAYDKDGIKIILKGVNTNRAYSDGAELIVYMFNGTDRNITVQTNEVIVNGYDMTSAMTCKLLPDKRAVDVVVFYTLDMMEHDIEEIDSVKVSFEIKDTDSWENIDSTELISVTLPEKEATPDAVSAE